ncbi:MAG: hypothetical protein ACK56F_18055, partial [bacterium]
EDDEDDESFKDNGSEGDDDDDEGGEDDQDGNDDENDNDGEDEDMVDEDIDKDELKALQKEAAKIDLSGSRRTRGGARTAAVQ